MTETPEPRLVKMLEAVLFAVGRTADLDELAAAVEAPPGDVVGALGVLDRALQERGVQLLRVAGGYRIVTRPEFADAVRRMLQPPPVRLTPARLETLAVIAYRQPITRAEMEAIRGVDCSGTVKTLLDLGLVELRGRRHDKPGRPLQYGTTARFLEEFALDSLSDLPKLEELEA